MNHHEFVHEMFQIIIALKRVLSHLPLTYERERKELISVKNQIENYIILPEEILDEDRRVESD